MAIETGAYKRGPKTRAEYIREIRFVRGLRKSRGEVIFEREEICSMPAIASDKTVEEEIALREAKERAREGVTMFVKM